MSSIPWSGKRRAKRFMVRQELTDQQKNVAELLLELDICETYIQNRFGQIRVARSKAAKVNVCAMLVQLDKLEHCVQ